MSSEAQDQNPEVAPPSPVIIPPDLANIAKYDDDVQFWIKELLCQQKQSLHFCECLLTKLDSFHKAFENLRICCQISQSVEQNPASDLGGGLVFAMRYQRWELEMSLRYAKEACQAFTECLQSERDKIQELESHLNKLYLAIDSWRLSQDKQKSGCFDDEGTIERLLLNKQPRQKFINTSEDVLCTDEQSIQGIYAYIDRMFQKVHKRKIGQGTPSTGS